MNISFPISLRSLFLLPHFLERDNGESKKAHWLGQKPPSSFQDERNRSEDGNRPPMPAEPGGYRDLASIPLSEVQDAYNFLENQLLPSPFPSWVGTNMFCAFDLQQRPDVYRPPAIFGRVRTCHPSDGYIHNIQVLELLFPHRDRAADICLLRNEDIDASRPIRSYGLRVKFLASPDELEDFKPGESQFLEQGIIPEFSADFLDLLHLREQDRETYPWFYVIGSRWFASIPESVKPEVRESVKSLVNWNKQVFNYHPRGLDPVIRTLNWELEFSYNFTEHFLSIPETPMDVVRILASSVSRMLERPVS